MGDYEYLNDALGVPGEVVAVETMTVQEIKKEITQIIEGFEEAGYVNTDQKLNEKLHQAYAGTLEAAREEGYKNIRDYNKSMGFNHGYGLFLERLEMYFTMTGDHNG